MNLSNWSGGTIPANWNGGTTISVNWSDGTNCSNSFPQRAWMNCPSQRRWKYRHCSMAVGGDAAPPG
jgi:uncharacterized protein with von Willebrand factor type A (vWA) domain